MSSIFVRRVQLKNYKSIASCSVDLHELTFLVGQNGAGKSNFLDAIRFVRDALRDSLDHALRERGGIAEVRRKSGGHPTDFGIRLDVQSPEFSGSYAFLVGAKKGASFEVKEERCDVSFANGSRSFFHNKAGRIFDTSEKTLPKTSRDRLFLVAASGLEPFRGIFELLSRMGFYNLNPKLIKELQAPQSSELLLVEGENIASVIGALENRAPEAMQRIQDYLSQVNSSVHGVSKKSVGPAETLEFRQDVGLKQPWRFYAQNMSDGTLRALGVLTALFQDGGAQRVPFVGIEEPEVALHPAAAKYLRSALFEASERTQVMVTSHSPELLDDEKIVADQVLTVTSQDNATIIAPLGKESREILRKHLSSAGELLRLNQLIPDFSLFDGPGRRAIQLGLFGNEKNSADS